MQLEFNPKDTRHKGAIPDNKVESNKKSDKKYLNNTPEERKGHSYLKREVALDGTTTYYYGGGVKAIHHPDKEKAGPAYHNSAKVHHEKKSRQALKDGDLKRAKAHGRAASGHDFAITAQGGTPSVQELRKFLKEFSGGTVAVASDPGVFTPTHGGSGGKKKKKEIPATGPQKLDAFLDNKPMKKSSNIDFAIDIIKSASRSKTELMDTNKNGKVEGKVFEGEAHYGDVAGFIPPTDSTEDQRAASVYRGHTTDVKKELTLFDLIQAEIEEPTELEKQFNTFLKEEGVDVE